MSTETTKPADGQNGTDANRDPITGTPVGTGVLVAGPEARERAGEMDPTVEDAYWKTNYSKQTYVDRNSPYTHYQPAYRTGYEGRSQYPGKKFEEVETSLQRDYEKSKGNSTLTWDKARNAIRDAWNRVEMALPGDGVGDGR
jgi:hypothetical protein